MNKPKDVDLLNGWLKYHNTTVEEVLKNHPSEELMNPDWFKLYPCTEEQELEWEIWAKEYVRKTTGLSKRIIEIGWWSIYLNYSPHIIKNDKPI